LASIPQHPPLGAAESISGVYSLAFVQCSGMNYERLADFVQNRMRMSHIYQPVLLMALLREGSAHIEVVRATLEQEGGQGDTA
jgi:hypothetical protein